MDGCDYLVGREVAKNNAECFWDVNDRLRLVNQPLQRLWAREETRCIQNSIAQLVLKKSQLRSKNDLMVEFNRSRLTLQWQGTWNEAPHAAVGILVQGRKQLWLICWKCSLVGVLSGKNSVSLEATSPIWSLSNIGNSWTDPSPHSRKTHESMSLYWWNYSLDKKDSGAGLWDRSWSMYHLQIYGDNVTTSWLSLAGYNTKVKSSKDQSGSLLQSWEDWPWRFQ